MQGLVRKGLLLSVATGALVLGGAAAAQADTATANGTSVGSEGAASGNVAQIGADNPINVCGDTADLVTAHTGTKANDCTTFGNSAAINGIATDDPGAVSGNVIGAAVDAPIQACGLSAQALGAGSEAVGNVCADTGTSASANGSTHGDAGLISGNVIQLAENAPISACGDDIGILAFASGATGNSCTNGAVLAPPPVMPPPPVNDCPPPPCPPTPPPPPVMPPPPPCPPAPPVMPPPPPCPPVMPPPPVVCPPPVVSPPPPVVCPPEMPPPPMCPPGGDHDDLGADL